jgi:predicted AAA+ superfamily ATPase
MRHFKTIYLDIGLMCAALKVNLNDLHRSDVTLINEGALAEQFIGQHLLYGGNDYEAPELFYWVREARTAAAEIDYLMTCGQQIVPVEIKAGATGTLKSLHQFLKEKNRHFALRFNADLPSLLGDAKKHTDGSVVDYELLSLPLYMVEQAPRLVKEILCPG